MLACVSYHHVQVSSLDFSTSTRKGSANFPSQWRDFVIIEDRFRCERWEIVRAFIETMVANMQHVGVLDPVRPWAAVFSWSHTPNEGSADEGWHLILNVLLLCLIFRV